jgi:hypothetical protein
MAGFPSGRSAFRVYGRCPKVGLKWPRAVLDEHAFHEAANRCGGPPYGSLLIASSVHPPLRVTASTIRPVTHDADRPVLFVDHLRSRPIRVGSSGTARCA